MFEDQGYRPVTPLILRLMPHARRAPSNHEKGPCFRVRVKVRKPVWAKARAIKDFKPNDLTQQQNRHPYPDLFQKFVILKLMSRFEYPRLIFSGPEGKIFDHPRLKIAGRSGDRMGLPHPSELVPLPQGSQLFSMPGRIPIGWDEEGGGFVPSEKVQVGGKEVECTAVAAFLPPGYIRSLLPATRSTPKAPHLPLWAYSSVGWKKGQFWATGLTD